MTREINTSKLNEAQKTLYFIAENMKMDKSISEEGYEHFQQAIKALSQEPRDDAISRILQRMWNCRGKHTTSIDKVKMEQIIRDKLPSVTQKSGKWILTIEDWNKWACSNCGYVKRTDIHVNIGWKYCPNCGAKMESEVNNG